MEVNETKMIAGSKFLSLFERTFTHEGHSGKWMFASREENPSTHEYKKPDAVVIVPFVIDQDEPKIALTAEYRIPILAREMGFPAGLIDDVDYEEAIAVAEKGDDLVNVEDLVNIAAVHAATRECHEETNLSFFSKKSSPPNLYSSAGMTNESTCVVMGTATGDPSNKNCEKSEDIEVFILNREEIGLLLDRKTHTDYALSVKAWMILQPIVDYGFPHWVIKAMARHKIDQELESKFMGT